MGKIAIPDQDPISPPPFPSLLHPEAGCHCGKEPNVNRLQPELRNIPISLALSRQLLSPLSLPMAAPSKLPKAKLLRAPSLVPGCVLPSELPRLCSPASYRGSPGRLPAVFFLASFLGSVFLSHGRLRPWPGSVFPSHGWLRPWPGSSFSSATRTRLPTASICSSRCIASALPFSLVFSREGLNFECPTSQQAPDPHLPLVTFSLSLLHSISHPSSRCMEGGMNRAYVGEAPSKLPQRLVY